MSGARWSAACECPWRPLTDRGRRRANHAEELVDRPVGTRETLRVGQTAQLLDHERSHLFRTNGRTAGCNIGRAVALL